MMHRWYRPLTEYTVNVAAIPILLLSALLIVGALPIAGLTRAETVLTGFVVLYVGEAVKLTFTGTARWLRYVCWAIIPSSLFIMAYGLGVLLTGAH